MAKENARPNELETSAPSKAKFTGTDNQRQLCVLRSTFLR